MTKEEWYGLSIAAVLGIVLAMGGSVLAVKGWVIFGPIGTFLLGVLIAYLTMAFIVLLTTRKYKYTKKE